MQNTLQEIMPKITSIRQQIHSAPELKYQENATAKLVADTLKELGYEVITGIAKTGVSAILDSGKSGKTVALRADMDALPIQEESDLPYRSKNAGKMHACGHDGHTATLLAVASLLKKQPLQFPGKIKFIFQPAEEGGAGAAAMIKAGILTNPKVDAIFGYHNWPSMAVGKMGARKQCLLASIDNIEIKIIGKGGHGAFPHQCIDPLYIGTVLVQNLQSIISRNILATDPVVLSVTQFHAGTGVNIIANEAVLTLTLRATTKTTRELAIRRLQEIIENTTAAFGAKFEINYLDTTPATINWDKETDLVLNTARNILGNDNCEIIANPIMGSEDFSYYLEQIPGCFFIVGNGEDSPNLHTSKYNFQDKIIPIAAEILAQTAINYLNQK